MVYWVWLQQALGYGNKAGKLILNRFKNAETVFNLSEKEIISCGFLNKKYIEKLSNKNLKEAQNKIRLIEFLINVPVFAVNILFRLFANSIYKNHIIAF